MNRPTEYALVEVLVEVESEIHEVATAELMLLGCTGVEIRDHEVSALPVGRTQVLSWHQDHDGLEADIQALCTRLGPEVHYTLTRQIDTAWTESLRSSDPLLIGDTLVVRQPQQPPVAGKHNVVISPGGGFGHGTHPTTVLSLGLLETTLRKIPTRRLLDLGTGTGILGLSALAWGVEEVWAIDSDASALEAARQNAHDSGWGHRMRFSKPDQPVDGPFDGCVANLYLGVLTAAAPRLAKLCKPNGFCIVSGFTADLAPGVEACFTALGFEQENVAVAEPWIAVEWRKLPNY